MGFDGFGSVQKTTPFTCYNQTHVHDLELLVWKCVLLFIPVFPCMISGSPKHSKKPYRVSGENAVFGKIAIQDIKDFVKNR